MRACNAARLQCGPLSSLPILPFLAPRVFAPWPEELRSCRNVSRGRDEPITPVGVRSFKIQGLGSQECLKSKPQDTRVGTCRRSNHQASWTSRRRFSTAVVLTSTTNEPSDTTNSGDHKAHKLDSRSTDEAHIDSVLASETNSKTRDVFEDEDGLVGTEAATLLAQNSRREDDIARQWYNEMVQEGGEDTLHDAWNALTPEMRSYRWPTMVSWYTRHNDLPRTWDFIERTLENTDPSTLMVQRAFRQATHAIPSSMARTHCERLANSIFVAIQICRDRDEEFKVPTATLRFLVSHSATETIKIVHKYLSDQDMLQKPSVLVRLAFQLARAHDSSALDLLERATLPRKVLYSASSLDLCALILNNARDMSSPTKTKPEVLARIMQLGVPLETRLINSLIRNAVESNDTETAMRIYSKLKSDGRLKANHDTYLLLLPCLHAADNLGWFLEVQRDMRVRGIQHFSPQVAHELMLARYRHTKNYHFDIMLGLYEVQFSLQPLKQLGIVSADYQARRKDYARSFCGPLPLPNRAIVELMLHIFNYSKPRRVLPMVDIYRNLVRLRNSGDPLFLLLARRHTPWSIILKSLCMREGTLRAWPQVIRDMESLALDADGKPYTHPWTQKAWQPPSASTARIWNIILNGYARRGHMADAEHVLELMSQRHIEPDLYTFTPLLRGYATKQDINGIEHTLRRIEIMGRNLEMNEHTRKALAPFEDKDTLAKALEESSKRKKNPYTSRPADELFESEETPAPPGSADEFVRWNTFAQAAREESKIFAEPSQKAARRDAFVHRLGQDQNASLTPAETIAESAVNVSRPEDIEMDDIGSATWSMDEAESEAEELDEADLESINAESVAPDLGEDDLDMPYVFAARNTTLEVATESLVDPLAENPDLADEPTRRLPHDSRNTKHDSEQNSHPDAYVIMQKETTEAMPEQMWTLNQYLTESSSQTRSKKYKKKLNEDRSGWYTLESERRNH